MSVRGMSSFLRTRRGLSGYWRKGKRGLLMDAFAAKWKVAQDQGLGSFDKV